MDGGDNDLGKGKGQAQRPSEELTEDVSFFSSVAPSLEGSEEELHMQHSHAPSGERRWVE